MTAPSDNAPNKKIGRAGQPICTHFDGGRMCAASGADVRLFVTGSRCPAHTPAALAGNAEVTPDPSRTLAALRTAAGLPVDAAPPIASSSLNDERAVASGKRRSSTSSYRAARAAEDARKAKNAERSA